MAAIDVDRGVYLIKNTITGKVYVGSSQACARRWREHVRKLNAGRHHCVHLQRSWKKRGAAAFTFEVIERVEVAAHLVAVEQTLIDYYRRAGLAMNRNPTAGSCLGRVLSQETKDRIAAKAKGRLLGVPQDPAFVARRADQRRGKRWSPEMRARGRTFTAEHRANLSASRLAGIARRKSEAQT